MHELASFEILLRLLAATIAGVALGLDRELHGQATGMRTLGLVALGAAAISAAGSTLPQLGPSADAHSRVIQGVVQGVLAGIGFLGAGVILRTPHDRRVRGMTTAANVWTTAALGVVFGLGQWRIAGVTFAVALVLLVGVARIETAFALKGGRKNGSPPPES